MVSKTKKKKARRRGGARTRTKTAHRTQLQLDKFASPISQFEHYPTNSDYDSDTTVPYVWNKIPLLLDTKQYINGLGITKTKLESITTDTSKKPNINVLRLLAKETIGYRDDMTGDEMYNLVKPGNERTANIQYKYDFPTCDAIKENIPAFKVPTTIYEGGVDINGTNYFLNEPDFQEFNNTLCKTFLLLGVVSKYLWEDTACDYFILIKGGKAVQLLLHDKLPYDSHDIDISIVPKAGHAYNLDSAHAMALHVGRLLKWFLSGITVKEKPSDAEYATVVKLYCCDSKYAFCDIDYGKQSDTLFNYDALAHFTMDFDSLYISSNLEMTLKEKCYYFIDAFNNTTQKYAKFRMDKNKKAIVRLVDKTVARKYIEKYADPNNVELMIQYLYSEKN
jgi:hypothetical protein